MPLYGAGTGEDWCDLPAMRGRSSGQADAPRPDVLRLRQLSGLRLDELEAAGSADLSQLRRVNGAGNEKAQAECTDCGERQPLEEGALEAA